MAANPRDNTHAGGLESSSARPQAEHDPNETTQKVPVDTLPAPNAGLFETQALVRVRQLETQGCMEGNLDLGNGRLLGRLTIGQRLRLDMGDGRAIHTSPVHSFSLLGPRAVQVVTATNSVYRLDIV